VRTKRLQVLLNFTDKYLIKLRALGLCAGRNVQQVAVLSYGKKSMKNAMFDSKMLMKLKKPPLKMQTVSRENTGKFTEHNKIEFSSKCLNHSNCGKEYLHPNTTNGEDCSRRKCILDLSSYSFNHEITMTDPDYRFELVIQNFRQQPKDVFGDNKYNHFIGSS
jgi:hypothetical protein